MNVTPSSALLLSLRNNPLSFPKILAELLDNACDAKATHIEVSIKPNSLSIVDNGHGVKDFAAMFRLGHHAQGESESLGRYGVGLKEAGARLWGTMTIASARDHVKRSVVVDWQKWYQSNQWYLDDPIIEAMTGEESWTRITFKHTDKGRIPSGSYLDAVLANVNFLYAPAVELGVRIVVRRLLNGVETLHEFTGWPWPNLSEVVDVRLNVDGKSARLRAGIVQAGDSNLRSGLHYAYLHRMILEGSSVGCGDFGTGRIFGVVTMLGGEWTLSKNKDAIDDDDVSQLAEQVYGHMEPLLKKAETQSHHLSLSSLENALTDQLNMIFGHGKARRDRLGEKGTHGHNTPPGAPHRRATNTQPSNEKKLSQPKSTGLRLEFRELPYDDLTCVEVPQRRVSLNIAHPWVVWVLKQKQSLKESSLLVVALAAYLDAEVQLNLYPCERGATFRFAEKMGLHLKGWIKGQSDAAV